MATRTPLVTTRVGQAADLVRHGENGWMVDPEDVDGLVAWTLHVATAGRGDLDPVLEAGRAMAEETSYDALRPRWRALLEGFVALGA
jgi:glycosyltransferase involved in cell wall biosynthesis